MDRRQVIAALGTPDAVDGKMRLETGTTLQTDEYDLYGRHDAWFAAAAGIFTATALWWIPPFMDQRTFLVRYQDGKLVRWEMEGAYQSLRYQPLRYPRPRLRGESGPAYPPPNMLPQTWIPPMFGEYGPYQRPALYHP